MHHGTPFLTRPPPAPFPLSCPREMHELNCRSTHCGWFLGTSHCGTHTSYLNTDALRYSYLIPQYRCIAVLPVNLSKPVNLSTTRVRLRCLLATVFSPNEYSYLVPQYRFGKTHEIWTLPLPTRGQTDSSFERPSPAAVTSDEHIQFAPSQRTLFKKMEKQGQRRDEERGIRGREAGE